MEMTKKEMVIELAQNNPFLKVEEIAEEVNTSKRYVRSVLSESGLSLTEERKRYAKYLEEEVDRLRGEIG